MNWQISLPLDPVAWERVDRGRNGHAFVPAKTRKFKNQVKQMVMREFKAPPLKGALTLTVNFNLVPPKRRVREKPHVRPDLSNYLKAVEDALNGVLWDDDGQLCKIVAEKRYTWVSPKGSIDIQVEGAA